MTAPAEGTTFRQVPGFEAYEVSPDGRVRRNGRELRPSIHKNGYRWVSLSVDGKVTPKRLHHVVLMTYVGPRPNGLEGCHFDDDRANNSVENLRWATQSENMQDRIRNGRHNNAKKTHCKRDHEFTPENTRTYRRRRTCLTCERARWEARKNESKSRL